MKGYIRKRGNTYSYTVDIGRDPLTGKRKQKTKGGFKTKKAAQEALNEIVFSVNKGIYVVNHDCTVQQLFQEWLDNQRIKWEITTYEVAKRSMEKWVISYLGQRKIKDLTPAHGRQLMDEMLKNLCIETVRQIFSKVNQMLNYAVDMEWLAKNPFSRIPLPKLPKHEKGTWNFDEIKKFLSACLIENVFCHNVTTLAAFTGLRKGEIFGLRVEDIDFENKVLHVRQALKETQEHDLSIGSLKNTSSWRDVKLDDLTIKVLKNQIRRNKELKLAFGEGYHDLGIVFCRENGYYYRPSGINKPFNRLVKKTGVTKIRFHDLRHTHATLLLQIGTNPKLIADRLGHSDVKTTLNTYSHVTPSMQEKAINDLSQAYQTNG